MRSLLLGFAICAIVSASAQHTNFPTTDTMRGIVYYNQFALSASQITGKKDIVAIGFANGSLVLETHKKANKRSISFQVKGNANQVPQIFALGEGVETAIKKKKGEIEAEWNYPFAEGKNYQFQINALADSADKITIYTAYIHLPETGSWKLLAAFKRTDDGNFLKGYNIDAQLAADRVQPWVQTDRGRWNTLANASTRPQIDWSRNHDSVAQAKKDIAIINEAVANKKIDTSGSKESVYYSILKEGTGKYPKVTDTVTVRYKGSLLSDGSIFDQTKDKPAVFPLGRLIKGWQIAIPMCKVGGTVRVIIPSALAYSIRTRSKNIPPNSILVFDIDIIDAK
jgi:FKBP-type peptidyl-prolyl cis-trans isomerase FkpA